MIKKINIPVVGIGPGSQVNPDDEDVLKTPISPGEMNTYIAPELPIIDDIDNLEEGISILHKIKNILEGYNIGNKTKAEILEGLNKSNHDFINQVLGHGEVSILYKADIEIKIQESVFAGVWRILHMDKQGELLKDMIEVADIPSIIRQSTFSDTRMPNVDDLKDLPAGILNSPPVITEICNKINDFDSDSKPYVINLTLLPQTEDDLAYINEKLGLGSVTILSRGYGNCRITSTKTPNTWWVQYFNSDDTNILNTIEISEVPIVACAAQEDIKDSKERLSDILDIYK